MKEITITADNFESEVLQSDKPVLVDFWASWCGPCKMLAPVLAQLAETHDEIKVGKVNIDDEQELAINFSVMSIPTLIMFKDGQAVNQTVGVQSLSELENFIRV